MCVCVCVCARVRARACVRACVCVKACASACVGVGSNLEKKKKKKKDFARSVVVYVILDFTVLLVLHILSSLLFLYCALLGHVRCKRLTNTLLHYITLHYSGYMATEG